MIQRARSIERYVWTASRVSVLLAVSRVERR
jgi:hypothetical protein